MVVDGLRCPYSVMGEVAGLRGRKEDTVSLPHQAASGTATRCNGTQPTDEAMFQTRLKREPGMQEVSSGIWMIWMMRIEGYFTFFFLPHITARPVCFVRETPHRTRYAMPRVRLFDFGETTSLDNFESINFPLKNPLSNSSPRLWGAFHTAYATKSWLHSFA